jgi:transcription elongation factor Elf1
MFIDLIQPTQSDVMKTRWADPEFKAKMSEAIKSPPNCPVCGETDIAKFYLDKKGGRSTKVCRECHKAQCKARWHARTPVEKQATRVKAMYGITSEEYKQMYEAQDGKCKICNTAPTTKRGLNVDHCHVSGKVRGLLCHGCNTALGSFKDDPTLLMNAIEYLRSF